METDISKQSCKLNIYLMYYLGRFVKNIASKVVKNMLAYF